MDRAVANCVGSARNILIYLISGSSGPRQRLHLSMEICMRRRPSLSVLFLIGLLLFPIFGPILRAQTAPPPPPQTPTPQQLDQLLAPIALYPDSLLAQITTASTNPQEILDVDNWLAKNPNLTGTGLTDAAQQQGFDPAFVSLVNFPTVLQMMAEHIDDYAAIGQAVTANQAEVSASIQRLRAQAYASGTLQSNQQQQVQVQQASNQPIYVIQPANPQVVYVPQYDPTVVYVRPSTGAVVAASLITFGVGIGIGALIASSHPWGWGGWGWNWGGRSIYYNHGAWGGWHGGYRPPSYWYRPRPVPWNSRPGYGGNWGYRPPNYRPPRPVNRPIYNQPGYRPGTGPGYRPGTGNGYKPGTPNNRPPTTRPTPTTRPAPSTRPAPTTRPAPSTRPTPSTQPAPAPRPAPQNRPAPQSRPSNTTQQRPSTQPSNGKPAPQHRSPQSGGGGEKPQSRGKDSPKSH
jgi:Protein of unknown function (DUF3300)